MSFEDLPVDWTSRPLTDPRLAADVIDLLVQDDDRLAGSVAVLLCDDEHRLLQPVVVALDTVDTDPPPHLLKQDKHRLLQRFTQLVEPVDRGSVGSLLVAVARPKGAFVTDDDREWHEVAIRACREAEALLLGFYVVTRHTVREVVDPGAETRHRRPA